MSSKLALSAAEAGYGAEVDLSVHADALRSLSSTDVIKYFARENLGGIINVVLNMKLAGDDGDELKEAKKLLAKAYAAVSKATRRVPLSNLGISFPNPSVLPDIFTALMLNTKGLTNTDLEKAATTARNTIKSGTTVYLCVQPRESNGKVVSIHFTIYWIGPKGERRAIESYNLMKEGDSNAAKAVSEIWNDKGLTHFPRKPSSGFELMFAASPANPKVGVTDITQITVLPEDASLMGTHVFGTAAGDPNRIIYECKYVLEQRVTRDASIGLETLFQLAEVAREGGNITSFGLHQGTLTCLHIGEAATGNMGCFETTLADVFNNNCDTAAAAYRAKKPKTSTATAMSRSWQEHFEQVSVDEVRKDINSMFEQETMCRPRDPTRTSYRSQYIENDKPHPDSNFQAIGIIGARACASELGKANVGNMEENDVFKKDCPFVPTVTLD
jgi:hypothetical protein